VLCTILLSNCLLGQSFTNMTGLLNNTWGSTPCIADMDGDGLDDVVTLSGNDISIDYQQPDGTFDQVIYDVNAQNTPSWSIAAGDLNSDGYLDLMFGGGSRVSFYLSNSTGTAFTEQFIDDYIFSQRTNIVDIDNDGDLDAFACHDVDLSHPYRNDGTGLMTEDQSLIATVPLPGNYASVWTDFDNDGDTDLYIAKCRLGSSPGDVERENALYVNDGSGNYSGNVIADYGLFDNEQSWVTIFEDFDNDGDFDTYTVNHTNQNFLRANDGTGNFTDVSAGSGLDLSDIGAWALIGADFDNDGYVDMLMEASSSADLEYWHNDGDFTFTGGSLPFDKGALGDLNNDGYIDVFTGGTLWMNDGGSNNYIKVDLTGTNSNLDGIGARVECYSDLGMQIRESRSGENFKPMSSLDVFFGLGTDTEVDSVIVRWPSGQVDVVVSPAINTRISVLEGLLPAVVRLTKVDPNSQEITLKNFGGEPEDISAYRICSEFSCTTLGSLTPVNGDLILSTGEEVTLAWTTGSGFTVSGSDMSLFLPTGNMNSAAVMVDFTQWGSGGNGSESVAVAKGIWEAGDFIPLGFDYFYTGSGFQDGVAFWQESVFCPEPSDGVAFNLSTTGADLSWTENGSATSWDIEIGLADFIPTGTPTDADVSIPYAFSGTEGTAYDFYLRSNCAASGGIGLSDWAGPFRFTVPLPVSFCDVAIDVSVGGTFNTGFIDGIYEDFQSCMASDPDNANWFVYSATANGTLIISSVGLSGVDTQVSVGVGTCGSLTEVACDDDFTGAFPYESQVEFQVTAGTDYYIMWGDGWTSNASDFTVTFISDDTCNAPSDLQASDVTGSTATISWTENGTATTWDLEIGEAGFSPTGTPTNAGVANPFAFSGTEGTTYDFYVRADCASSGGTGESDWAGPLSVTLNALPPGSACNVAIDVSSGGTYNTGVIDGEYDGFETCMGSNPDNANWFIYSATLDGTLNISSMGLSGVDTEVSVGVGTCNALTEVACSDDFIQPPTPPYESEVEFEVTAGTDYYIMWGNGWTANASDFTVTFTPTNPPICNAPSDLLASNLTFTGADITWTENGTATNWDLEIGIEGFTPSGTPTNSTTAASYALTGAEGQSFDIYVRADCGFGSSDWTGPLNVTILNSYPGGQWLEFSDATPSRLSLSTVANSDDEEKDIAVADLDNDGFDDVIVCRKEPFSLSAEGAKSDLLLMNEDGVLTDRTLVYAPQFISTESFARDLYIGDFDGDGWKDVIIVNTFGQQPQYYANQGDDGNGNWLGLSDESATRFPTLTATDLKICGVSGGDIDGDDDEDIYMVSYKQTSGQGVAEDFLLINDGNGVFTDQSEARLGNLRNSAFGTSVQIYDMDNDGDEDILKVSTLFAVLPWGDVGLFVLFNEGAGTFSNWQSIASDAPYTFEVADFNDDGFLDVFVVNDGADHLVTVNSVVADNSLNFTTTNVVNGLSDFGGNIHAVDLDLDGDLDIAVSDVVVDVPPCNSTRRLALLENQEGVFVDHHTEDVFEWEVNSYDHGFADINGDGLQDIITGGCSGYNVFMSDNCQLVTSSADFDLDGLADACDACPTNPDPNCEPDVNFPTVSTEGSIARQWNELLLESIRKDFARPTVHARNLFHTSLGMWDAWAAYDELACTYLLGKTVDGFTCDYDPVPLPSDVPAARDEAMSYMAYRLLSHRFAASTNASLLQMAYDAHMDTLGYDINVTSVDYGSGDPAALGNYIAQCIINFGLQDGSNEQNGYVNQRYEPVNPPMIVKVPGNSQLEDWNRWQPLSLDLFIDQSGNQIPGSTPEFLSPEWGQVSPFALDDADKVTFNRDNFDYEVYHDPGTPPLIDTTGVIDSEAYRWGFMTTMLWSSHLDPNDGVMWDISPASIGKRDELPATIADYPDFYNQMDGGTTSPGHSINPSTGMPYAPNMVPRADYARVLAEFWADGPDSETPPGHWFTLLNYVSDHDSLEKRFMGEGPVLDDLEWDVKSYFMMGGAMHDAAVSTWGIKGWYDYLRPISAIRAMAGKGQSTNPGGPSYHPAGVPLIPDYIEVIEVGDPLAGDDDEFVGDIKIKAWKGHNAINNIDVDAAGVDWILASEWEPYQRPSFVTPPFAGYISGHSTFSRAAAEVMTSLTGDAYFPGGMGTFIAEQDEFLVFEDGPSVTVELQWATYQDAADESGLSRIWGGIHPPCDDIPGRKNGIIIGQDAFSKAVTYFGCSAPEPCENPFPAVDEESLSTVQSSNHFSTSWDAIPGQIGCQIQVRFAGGSPLGGKIVGGANANGFNIPFGVLQPATDYEWRVRCGCSQAPLVAGPFSSWQPFSTPGGSNLASNPNPTEGQSNVTFTVGEDGYTTLEVYDMSGRMIDGLFNGVAQSNSDYRFAFDGSSLPNGVYIYRLTTDREVINEKFMIAR